MVIASRGMEGGRPLCPFCKAPLRVKPFGLAGAVACPECRCRLWFFRLGNELRFYDPGSVRDPKREQIEEMLTWIQESPWNTTGMDSLDIVEFIMELEERFGLEVLERDAMKLKTLTDVIDYLESRLFDPSN